MVVWLDAHHEFGWQDGFTDEFEGPGLVYSLGWVVNQSDDAIRLAQSVADDNFAQTLVIPAQMVKAIIPVAMNEKKVHKRTVS